MFMETIINIMLNKLNGLSRIRKEFLVHIFVLYTVSTLVFYGTEIACCREHVFLACPEDFSGQKG